MSRFVSVRAVREASGLRLVGLRAVPSPWTEAAKGIFHVKGVNCQYAAPEDTGDQDVLVSWAGDSSIPVVAWEREPVRTGWQEILILAERLAPEPALIPLQPDRRVLMFGLSRELCGELGFGWCVRLLALKAGFDHSDEGAGPGRGFSMEVASRLAGKYGFNPVHVGMAQQRTVEILTLLNDTLGSNRYFIDDRLTALDIYWATMANLVSPLPEEALPMSSVIREVYTSTNQTLLAALTPALRDHQQRIYRDHLELPVPL